MIINGGYGIFIFLHWFLFHWFLFVGFFFMIIIEHWILREGKKTLTTSFYCMKWNETRMKECDNNERLRISGHLQISINQFIQVFCVCVAFFSIPPPQKKKSVVLYHMIYVKVFSAKELVNGRQKRI